MAQWRDPGFRNNHMSMTHCRFSFEPVGQGLFAHGRLACPGLAAMRLVFDCGVSGFQGCLRDAIAEYKAEYSGPDVLVISHLHDDHVSGVARLLEDHTCEAVILPYLSPIARAAAVAASESIDPNFLALAANPQAFFLEGDTPRARRVVFVSDGGGEGSPEGEAGPDEPDGQRDNPAEPQDRERMISVLRRAIDAIGRTAGPTPDSAAGGAIVETDDSRTHRLIPCWQFRFFVRDPLKPRAKPVSEKVCAAWGDFEAEVRRILGIPVGSDIPNAALAKALKDKAKVEELRAVYRQLGDLNANGLSLWVGRRTGGLGSTVLGMPAPSFLGSDDSDTTVWVGKATPAGRLWRSVPSTAEYNRNSGSGILFTGDADFAENGHDIAAHFKAEWPSTGIVQVPHHGSRHSWDDAVFRILNEAMPYPSFWPLNAGLLNRYGHPHQAVVRALTSSYRTILAANHEHAAVNFDILTGPRRPVLPLIP
jgi:hypothetical protein